MQKFVVKKPHNNNLPQMSMNGTESHVRLAGYLKKKRIKVGGWKKLWFVLQNQFLLLSFNSKKDYEEKLAPFIDVISLVPGTQILPMHQNRFTIETPAKVLYIFRCDDAKSCSEWITALMESLNANSLYDNPMNCMNTNFHIPKPMFTDVQSSSGMVITKKLSDMPQMQQENHELDSLNFFNQKGPNRQIARLPIAPITAKILQRGSFHEDEDDDHGNEKVEEIVIQNFRLHDEFTSKQAENQSIDVSRINSMFHACEYSTTIYSNNNKPTTIINEGDCVETLNFKKLIKCEIVQNSSIKFSPLDTYLHKNSNNNAKDNDKKFNVTTNKHKTSDNDKISEYESKHDTHLLVKNVNEKVNIDDKSKENRNNKKSNIERKNSFLDQITNGKSVFNNMKKFIVKKSATVPATDLNRNLNGVKNESLDKNINQQKIKENTADVVDYCNVEEQIQNITLEDEDDFSEDENDNSNETNSNFVLTQQISPIIKRNSYQNITEIEIPDNSSPKNSLREIGTNLISFPLTSNEPVVYATINLEDKHSRRALRSNTESPEKSITIENEEPPKPIKIQNQINTDYEEVGMYIASDGSEDETIYEPVDIPKTTNHAQALWNNLKKINVDALWLELTRKMREKADGSQNDDDDHTLPNSFREFKRKLGDQRRSLKARMQKMYHRSDSRQSSSEEKDEINSEENVSSSASHHSNIGIPLPGLANTKLFAVNDNVIKDLKQISSNKSGSKASRLKARIGFGSLGRVKKSRTSMFFEEFVPAKKITTNNDLQNYFKKELTSVVCDTKLPEINEIITNGIKRNEKITESCHRAKHESI
uniref:CSON005340 protein n=1 Tax=Culicoides sonorensis TaxID=179676 RepID=A0A336LV16_CULSO